MSCNIDERKFKVSDNLSTIRDLSLNSSSDRFFSVLKLMESTLDFSLFL
jgi:hypothetical protein